MLSIIAAIVIAICGTIVFCAEESKAYLDVTACDFNKISSTGRIALALSFVVLLCACIFAGNSCYLVSLFEIFSLRRIHLCNQFQQTELPKLQRLKSMCILSMGLVCFQLCIASFRVRKYLDHGERFALVTSIIYLVAQLTLIYTLHSTKANLKTMNEEKSSAKPTESRPATVWV